MTVLGEQYRILVAEQIADTGVDLLRERFSVDVATDLVGGGVGGSDRGL